MLFSISKITTYIKIMYKIYGENINMDKIRILGVEIDKVDMKTIKNTL